MAVALREQAEGVDEAGVDEVLEALALLVRETLLAAVGLGIREVELGVRDVEVAAEDHRLLLLELLAVGEEGRVPVLVPQLQARQVVLGVGRVHRDGVELLELGGDDAPFVPRSRA